MPTQFTIQPHTSKKSMTIQNRKKTIIEPPEIGTFCQSFNFIGQCQKLNCPDKHLCYNCGSNQPRYKCENCNRKSNYRNLAMRNSLVRPEIFTEYSHLCLKCYSHQSKYNHVEIKTDDLYGSYPLLFDDPKNCDYFSFKRCALQNDKIIDNYSNSLLKSFENVEKTQIETDTLFEKFVCKGIDSLKL